MSLSLGWRIRAANMRVLAAAPAPPGGATRTIVGGGDRTIVGGGDRTTVP
jgi:hypothetical protein